MVDLLTKYIGNTKLKVQFAIASFGRREIIRKVLNDVLGIKIASKIFITTPGDYTISGNKIGDGTDMGDNYKNLHLQNIFDRFCKDKTDYQNVIFYDDTDLNVTSAKDKFANLKGEIVAPFPNPKYPSEKKIEIVLKELEDHITQT